MTLSGDAKGTISMPCELYISGDAKYSFFILRSSICSGMIRDFGDALVKIIKE